jgi:aspartate/methionine/tyrosine aminotransferase
LDAPPEESSRQPPVMFAHRTKWDLASNRLSEALAKQKMSGLPVIDLTASNPTNASFIYDEEAILNALRHPGALKYEPDPLGLQSARRAVAGYYQRHAPEITADNILLTTSTSEAYSFIFRTLCNPGDEILVPAPSYPLFDFLADIEDVKLVPYPLFYDHGWHIDFHFMKQSITARSRGMIVVHPNNPTGHFTKPQEAQQLNAICAAHELALVADEVFLDFTLEEGSPPSFASNTEALTFTLGGLSKICGLPQMKIAWIVANGPGALVSDAMARLGVIADTYLSLNTSVQLATPVFLNQRENFLAQVTARVRSNLDELDRQLSAQSACSRLKVEGGWYAVLQIPRIRGDEDFAIELLMAQSVYIHPGHFYNFPPEGRLVVSLITRTAEFAEGVRRLLSMF